MQKKTVIELNPREKSKLAKILEDQTIGRAKQRRAQVVFLIDQGYSDIECSKKTSMSTSGIKKIRDRYKIGGLEGTINGKPKGHRPRALSAESEARLYAMASERTMNGRKAWTLKSLRSHLLEAEGTSLTLESIRRIIKRQSAKMAA
ncbi:MAG: helix-turn-helix domain-containing protein [Deltaproteobacteria bacterium]|jgi:transposase|nr:helix-turn-helix domain-containing protein [Deltaproteobacteria bacterium]